ncbi:MAG TPA: 50S ribosomal protein L25/general stress protein Ctc [Bacteroidales bacterium]|nr:50S ribosomal protein L25/general stress protein Ctc [Bacteroidales bacterium]
MKTIEIKGSLRTELGKKSSKQIRKAEGVPCVIYAKENNIHFQAPEIAFKNLVFTHEAHLVDLNLDNKVYKAVLQDIQFHPVSDRIIHADFVQIVEDKPVIISVPVSVHGDSIGVIAGGKLSIRKRALKIKGLPKDLPEHIPVDITDLKIHDNVKVGDLSMNNIEFLDINKEVVVTIATSRVAVKTEGEGEGEAEAAEGAAAETPAAE